MVSPQTKGANCSTVAMSKAHVKIWAMDYTCHMSGISFFFIDAAQLQALQTDWQDLVQQYTTAEKGEAFFKQLVERYSEKGRAYHNLSHIKALLETSAPYKAVIENYSAIFFAIWFHDAIYNTQASDNEEQSALMAVEALTDMAVPEDTFRVVQKMILATKHHSAEGLPYDGKLFLDFDLSILGRDAAIYKEYSRAIRIEYDWVPEVLYRQGRRKVLSSFLHREKIYYSHQLAERFEAQARRNIENELTELAG
jgi:predicted metal-dependent HD superfamily phosphohydrolase